VAAPARVVCLGRRGRHPDRHGRRVRRQCFGADHRPLTSFAPARRHRPNRAGDQGPLQLHASDMRAPMEEAVSFLDEAVRAGNIYYYGLSNFKGWELQLLVSTARGASACSPIHHRSCAGSRKSTMPTSRHVEIARSVRDARTIAFVPSAAWRMRRCSTDADPTGETTGGSPAAPRDSGTPIRYDQTMDEPKARSRCVGRKRFAASSA
jgi:hypothetical protein